MEFVPKSFSEAQAKIVIKTGLLALQYLNSKGIWHRDIKLENFLVLNSSPEVFKVLVCDLGYAKKFHHNEKGNEYIGTTIYAAPEILKGTPYNEKIDIWSLGVTMFSLLSGKLPFPISPESTMFDCIEKGAFFFSFKDWKGVSKEAKDLISNMIKVSPNERISVEEALQHPWFTK